MQKEEKKVREAKLDFANLEEATAIIDLHTKSLTLIKPNSWHQHRWTKVVLSLHNCELQKPAQSM